MSKKLTNSNIHGPTGALAVLKEIDFERIRDSGLQTKVVLYIATEDSATNHHNISYKGPVKLEISHSLSSVGPWNIILPKATYRTNSKDFREEIVPAWSLLEKSAKCEFFITAENLQEYDGLIVFRDKFLPAIFEAGYNQPNTDHLSEFWLYFGRSNLDKAEPVASIDVYDGLKIHKREVEGVMIFSDFDIDRLLSLRKKEPVAH